MGHFIDQIALAGSDDLCGLVKKLLLNLLWKTNFCKKTLINIYS